MSFSNNPVLAERKVDFPAIIRSNEPTVFVMMRENYELIFKFVIVVMTDYFNYAHPNMLPMVNRLASDLIETRQTWMAADFINLFKFLRQRQDIPEMKLYGALTPDKFMQMVCIYEEHRAQERERWEAEKKSEHLFPSERQGKDDFETFRIGKEIERAKSGWKQPQKVVPDEKYFEKK